MQIVHVVRQFHPAVGGIENVVWELASAQRDNGHSVRIVTLDRVFGMDCNIRLREHEIVAGFDVVRIPYFGSKRYPIALRVLRHIKDADIVHVHGIDFFFDYLSWTSIFHRRRLVVSTHGGFFHTSFASRLKRLYFPTVTRASLTGYAGVATISAADDRMFRSIRNEGVELIENGVNVVKYADASASTPTKAIIVLGRFSSNKRLDRVISFVAALRRCDPEWCLKIVGRPDDLSVTDVIELADEAGLGDATEVFAWPSDDDIREIIGECSVVVSGSEYEGFGLAAVECMSAGLFPVLSDIPPFRKLVEQTGVGILADFARPEFAAKLLLSRWDEIIRNHASHRQAAIAASSRFSWNRVGKLYEALYNFALGIRRRSILGIPIGVTTFAEATNLLDTRARDQNPDMVLFANAHALNQAVVDERAYTALRKAIVFNDGVGVDIASRLLFGKRFPDNLNGTDFVPNYLKVTRHRYRIFLLGGKPGIAERAADRLLRSVPQHQVVGCCHGYFDDDKTDELVDRIRHSRADMLLVAMGDPKQELWLMEHLAATGCRLGLGVGGLFDFMAGTVSRAPQWVRAARLEWLYRMLQEPRRLWRRYTVDMPIFLLRVGRQWLMGARVPNIM